MRNKTGLIWNFAAENDLMTNIYIYDLISSEKSANYDGTPGPEITADSFVQDLARMNTPKAVVHINSAGGDVFAAVAIGQAIKDARMQGKQITCQVDGVCASAAVTVAEACESVAIPRNGYMMIHDPAAVLFGLYSAADMSKKINQLDAVKNGIIAAYAEKTKRSTREISRMMAAETWMTGEQAVEMGFADSLTEEPVSVARDPVTNMISMNGAVLNRAEFENLPDAIKNATVMQKGAKNMEIRNTEDLRKAYPELVNQVENAAHEKGVSDERARIKALDDVANAVTADTLMQAKYVQPIDAKDMIYNAAVGGQLANNTATAGGAGILNAMAQDAQAVNHVGGMANGGVAPANPQAAEVAQVSNLASKIFGGMKK